MADKDTVQIDPICGMEVNEDNAAGESHYQSATYYFCSERHVKIDSIWILRNM